MRKMGFAALGAAGLLLAASQANALVLFADESAPGTYTASFVAEDWRTELSIYGVGGVFVLHPSVAHNADGTSPLSTGYAWTLTHSAPFPYQADFGSLSGTSNPFTLVLSTRYFEDTFSQIFDTVAGDSYSLQIISENTGFSPSGSWNAAVVGIPEPSAWALMLLGFVGLGAVRRARSALSWR